MKLPGSFLCMLCATSILAGCSYFEADESMRTPTRSGGLSVPPPVEETTDNEQNVFVEAVPVAAQKENIAAQPIPEPAQTMDVVDIANNVSGGSVEIFPIEGEAPEVDLNKPAKSSDRRARALDGIYSRDPSVEVFPLDDDMQGSMPQHLMPSSMPQGEEDMMPVPGEDHSAAAAPMAPVALVKPSSAGPSMTGSSRRAQAAPQGEFVSIQRPDGQSMRIYFSHDSTSIDQKALEMVSRITQATKANQVRAISVEGHASNVSEIKDPVQRKIVNLRVSMDRAFKVSKALIEKGVPAEMIRTVAWGEVQPPAQGAGSDQARRVEIVPYAVR